MNKIFLVQTIIITFIYLLALFIEGPKMVHLPAEIFFLKIVNIILIYLLASFTGQNLKKFFQRIQSYDMQFLGPKWPISPNEIFFFFFRKPVNEPCFLHLCPSTCQKSKSDNNLLVKY